MLEIGKALEERHDGSQSTALHGQERISQWGQSHDEASKEIGSHEAGLGPGEVGAAARKGMQNGRGGDDPEQDGVAGRPEGVGGTRTGSGNRFKLLTK